MTVWEPGMRHAECVAARNRHGAVDGTMFEVPDTARGLWRQRRLVRECIRIATREGALIVSLWPSVAGRTIALVPEGSDAYCRVTP